MRGSHGEVVLARYVEPRRHTDNDGVLSTAEGVQAAFALGELLSGGYQWRGDRLRWRVRPRQPVPIGPGRDSRPPLSASAPRPGSACCSKPPTATGAPAGVVTPLPISSRAASMGPQQFGLRVQPSQGVEEAPVVVGLEACVSGTRRMRLVGKTAATSQGAAKAPRASRSWSSG
jgi:hypothetical protein